jgi:hypothetical protein
MVRSTAWEVFLALQSASLTASIVDDISDICYFAATINETNVRVVLDPLEWTETQLLVLTDLADPYPQYLTVVRHDALLRHEIGTVVPHDSVKIDSSYLDTDGTLAANSDTKIATQKATKTYVDGKFGSLDALLYKGVQDCSSNPNYPAADAGDVYKVSVAGKIGGASGPNVEIGDMLICCVDSSASGDHATVGANWDIIQVNIDGAVTGPASATADAIVLYYGTTGKIIKDSLKTIVTTLGTDDSTVPTSLAVKTVTDGKASTSQKLDDFGTPDDNTDLNANTTNHGLVLKAVAPAANELNVVGIANGETSYGMKTLFDDTNPAMDGTAASGTSLKAAHRDHVHPSDTSKSDTTHNHDGTYCRWRGAGSSTPADPIAGDIWIDTSGTATPKIYDGSAWISLI